MAAPTSFSLLSEMSNPDWLVRDLIPRGALSLFTGARESGKTIVALLLAQGVATKYAFLRQPCAQQTTAFISRYEKRAEIHQLANRISPRLMSMTSAQVPVFGRWGPEDSVPEIGDHLSEELILKHYLIFDDIPDPEQTEDEDAEEFLRKAQHLARLGTGVALFGSNEWETNRAVKNRTDVHFTVVKNSDRITVRRNTGYRMHIDLPHRDSHDFQITITPQ